MERKTFQKKSQIFIAIIIVVFLILVGRLAYLQVFQVEKFKTMAQQNHMRLIPIKAPRGEMFARDGKTKLVTNQPVYTVSLMYLGLENTPQVVQRLADIMGIDSKEIQQKLDEHKLRLYEPIEIASNVPLETVLEIEQRRLELPGVIIDVEPVRFYPQGGLAAHVVGYVGEINQEELDKLRDQGYRLGDEIGKDGLEVVYEEYLRGEAGARQVEVDAQGRPVRDLGISQPIPGDSLVLTIDHKVQQAAVKALEAQLELLQKKYPDAKAAAVVALDVHTGEILAMASYPTYDPTVFTKPLSNEEYRALSEQRAFLNRTVFDYSPGSTIKMLIGAAGLAEGIIDPNYKYADKGAYYIDNLPIYDWKPGGHGMVDIYKALKESVNAYFIKFGIDLGQKKIEQYAREFGFGAVTGVDLPYERSGILPTPEAKFNIWKNYLPLEIEEKIDQLQEKYEKLMADAKTESERRKLKQQLIAERFALAENQTQKTYMYELEWHTYDTAYVSIGQGIGSYTPLQLANYVAAIANGGTLYRPHLVKKIVNQDGETVKEFKPEVINKVNIADKHLAVLREGMRRVVNEPGGTAYGLFNDIPVEVAAKTGTAEVGVKDNHALMVAYAPADNPKIAVACIVEHGASGGSAAGPIIHDILAAYFGGELKEGQIVHTLE